MKDLYDIRFIASRLANRVARMAGGSLQGHSLEGAVSYIERAIIESVDEALEDAALAMYGTDKKPVSLWGSKDAAHAIRGMKFSAREEE